MNFSFEQDLVFENEVALLRPIREDDLENLLPVATKDTDLLQYSPFPIFTEDLLQTYIERAIENRRDKIRYTFVVFDKKAQEYAGSTSFLNISNQDDRLEIGGTWYGKEFQRTGLNRHCKYLLLEYVFDFLGASRVEFRIDERNGPSRIAVEKIGGKYEGTLRSHTLLPDGFRRNTVCYSILDAEWEELKEHILDYKK
ncbi:GNAT family N-acetyltransferase [Algoriphagus mannitolivorans]|uniref:GNAT family N-acetyltransferase n=1 Tax=Algoriphagus mannitolivorans TaxID=226504 RepID=UPI00041A6534|nr:GNAT family protein [Algoriphagus mannitolivorans]